VFLARLPALDIAVRWFHVGFYLDGFWDAFLGARIVSIVSAILTILRGLGNGFLMRLQRNLVRLMGMLQSLPGEFMPRQVILFSSVLRCGTMSVCGQVVKFSSFPMSIAHNSSQQLKERHRNQSRHPSTYEPRIGSAKRGTQSASPVSTLPAKTLGDCS